MSGKCCPGQTLCWNWRDRAISHSLQGLGHGQSQGQHGEMPLSHLPVHREFGCVWQQGEERGSGCRKWALCSSACFPNWSPSVVQPWSDEWVLIFFWPAALVSSLLKRKGRGLESPSSLPANQGGKQTCQSGVSTQRYILEALLIWEQSVVSMTLSQFHSPLLRCGGLCCAWNLSAPLWHHGGLYKHCLSKTGGGAYAKW